MHTKLTVVFPPHQFAYHEASYFLIRLLQHFSSLDMAPEAQSPETRPPEEWGHVGPRGIEKIWPKTHITMYTLVNAISL